ncbi:RES domain-containing protein [Aurantimonas coralicida]|uniref:RES domain-containing protein n=1 Tax=Aurantimonas coralicida TaxID=182270 RepID=UPI0035140F2C
MALLCPFCFENKGLRRRLIEIRPDFNDGYCDRHPRRKGIPSEAVAELIDEVFRANFTLAGADWILGDEEEPGYYGPRRGAYLAELIEEMTGAEDFDIADTVAQRLIEDEFYWPGDGESAFYDEDQRYERILDDDGGHGALWDRFCQTVTYEQRFLNPEVSTLLGELFKHIHLQRDEGHQSPIYAATPADGLRIFRARPVNEAERKAVQADPEGQLGAPPRRLGRSNRMNPAGIPAFYAALDLKTCISELRPVVGSEIVYAEFTLMRDIVVLDTTRFSAAPRELNMFARDHVRRLTQWRFMQRFMAEIAKPVSPGDEPFDYVSTQVVAEYLNKVHLVRIGKDERRIDAILYRSAQRPEGINIVLLGDAALVGGRSESPGLRSPSLGLGDLLKEKPSPPTLSLNEGSLRSTIVAAAAVEAPPGLPLGVTRGSDNDVSAAQHVWPDMTPHDIVFPAQIPPDPKDLYADRDLD